MTEDLEFKKSDFDYAGQERDIGDHWEDVRLRRGRILTPVEQEKLIVLVDRFMDHKAINTARHSASAIDETACEIEELLTKAGWYPDVDDERAKLDRINQIISSGSSGPGEGERDQYVPPGSALGGE